MSRRKINILYVIDTLFIGGAEKHVVNLCRYINKERFHTVVCTLFSRNLSKDEPFAAEIEDIGIRVERFGLRSWRDIKVFKKYLNLIEEENIDIIHAHTTPAAFWGPLIARLFKHKKTIVTLHGLDLNKSLISKIQHSMVNICLTDKIIACSDLLKQFAINEYFGRPNKITIIPNMIDTTVFSPENTGYKIRTGYNIPNNSIVIGSVGRFVKTKAFEVSLEIFAKVKSQYPELKFLLCGYGEEEALYRNTVKNLGIENDVIFTGPRADIDEIMSAIDIVIFTPRYSEGFGRILIEAMASGKPIVASNLYPTPDIVKNNVCGFLPFPKEPAITMDNINIEPFVEKINYLIENKSERIRMGLEGRRISEEIYSAKVVMKQIEALYERVSCRS